MNYPDEFEAWAKSNPWMQENKAEAFKLWQTKNKNRSDWYRNKATKKKAKTAKKDKKVKYADYIKSEEWLEKSRRWRKATPKCELCGNDKRLQCHHLHYRTLGHERRRDIQVVCYWCHCTLHGRDFN